MSAHKNLDLICVVVLVLALILTILFMNGQSLGLRAVVDEDAERNSDAVYFTSADLNGDWDTSGAAEIALDTRTVTGNGAYFLDGDLVISSAGRYVLTGTLPDGSIIVDAENGSKVYLYLDGVSVTCSDDACLRVDEADKVFLTLAGDSTFTSGTDYAEAALEDGTDGVIYAHDDLTINGTGTLTLSGGPKHGLVAKDDLVITGGTLTVDVSGDAIRVNDSLRLCEAALYLTAGDEGIAVTNEEEGEGWLYVESGTIDLTAGDDGIHCTGDITIAGGTLTITAGDDGIHSDTGVLVSGGTVDIPSCYEGIEAITIEQTGGDITIYPTDDGLNANGGSGGFGNFGGGFGGGMPGQRSGETTGDGTASDQQPTDTADGTDATELPASDGAQPTPPDFSGGEMPELPTDENGETAMPDFSGGERPEWSTDENGETAMPDFSGGERPELPTDENGETTMPDFSGGELPELPTDENGETAMPDFSGEGSNLTDSAQSADEETWIRISGGTLTVINKTGRDADGMDSNGDIYISGGTIFVSVPGDGSSCAMDYGSESGGVAEITGGTIIACGGSSMAEAFDSTSTQVSFLYNSSETIAAGTTVTLTDSDGDVLLTCELPSSVSSILMSCPALTDGETYTLTCGSDSVELTMDGVSSTLGSASGMSFGGMMGGMGGGFGGGKHQRPGGRGSEASDATEQSAEQSTEQTTDET